MNETVIDDYGNLVGYKRLSIENIDGILDNWHSKYGGGSSSFERDYEQVYYLYYVKLIIVRDFYTKSGWRTAVFANLDKFVRENNDCLDYYIDTFLYVFKYRN